MKTRENWWAWLPYGNHIVFYYVAPIRKTLVRVADYECSKTCKEGKFFERSRVITFGTILKSFLFSYNS